MPEDGKMRHGGGGGGGGGTSAHREDIIVAAKSWMSRSPRAICVAAGILATTLGKNTAASARRPIL